MGITKKKIIDSAKKTLHYTNLLIEQCDNWLPTEENSKISLEKIRCKKKKINNKNRTKFINVSLLLWMFAIGCNSNINNESKKTALDTVNESVFMLSCDLEIDCLIQLSATISININSLGINSSDN